ncbi:MAG: S1C family serine protease, partial [Muribaculaceae bacterium]|nr:S1C family serine protease [Muribaculaceae bacterium]
MDDIENYIHGNLPEQENLTETVSNDNSGYENTSFAYAGFVYDTVPDEFQQYEELSGTVRKRKNTTGEKFIIFLFVVIILLAIGLSIYGIANDVYRSRSVMEELRKQQHIVMYQEGKPDGANDLNNFIDENGRYTIEGAAAAVKDSIVEIYTYSDAKKTKLEGTGSGVVISKDGYIVTNAHVLKSDGFHTVHTTDEKIYNAKIIGRDSKTDI